MSDDHTDGVEPAMAADNGSAPDPVTPGRASRALRVVIIVGLTAEAALFGGGAVVWGTPLGMLTAGAIAGLALTASLQQWLWPNSRVVAWLLASAGVGFVACAWIFWWGDMLERSVLTASVALVGYGIWLCVKYWKKPPKRHLPLSLSVGATALCLGAVLGAVPVVFLATDQELQPLGDLAVSRPDVTDGENALPAFESLMRNQPIPDTDELYELYRTGPGSDRKMPDDWAARARQVVAWFDGAGPDLAEMLSRPRFIAPAAPAGSTYDEVQAFQLASEWRTGLGTLQDMMLLRANVLLLEGRASESLRAAGQLVDLGVLVCADAESLVTLGPGERCVSAGLEAMRDAGGEATDVAEMRLLAGRLHMSDQLEAGLRGGLAGQLASDRSTLEAFARLDRGVWHGEPDAIPLRLFFRRIPLIKVNATANLLAAEMRDVLSRLDGYRRFGREGRIWGWEDLVREYGRGAVAGNIGGLVIAVMTPPIYRRSLEGFYRMVAEARLTRIFLALRCHQLEQGRLPASLDELVPAYFDRVPVDPFTGEPFGYDPEADMPVLYSVGPDLARDGPDDPDDPWEDGDDLIIELTFAARGDEQ